MVIKNKTFFASFFALLLMTAPAYADQTEQPTGLRHGLGFNGGYILGTGLTYVHYFGSHMLQSTFNGNVDQNKKDYQFALSYGRYLHHVPNPRSLPAVALKFIAGMDIHYQDGFIDSDVIAGEDVLAQNEGEVFYYHSGLGLGIDIGNPGKPGLVYSLMIVYALSHEKVDGQWEWEIGPLPAAGILYSW